jgi:hypothetical protein
MAGAIVRAAFAAHFASNGDWQGMADTVCRQMA